MRAEAQWVGQPCAWCSEPIAAEDEGVTAWPHLDLHDGGTDYLPYHRECRMRMVVGCVAHIEGRCSCFKGGEDHDDPSLTKREAARAAVLACRRLNAT